MMETNTEPLKTIRDFIRYCTTRLYSSEATFNHGYQNPEEEAAFLVLRTLRIPLEYEEKFLDAALTGNERETVLNNISRRCDDLEPTAYITKEWWLTGFPFYVDERVLIPRSYIAELIEKNFDGLLPDPARIHSILDMCTGSILKKMLIFSLPLMASSMLQLLFNAADIIVVGRFAGDNALAAVGSNTALINLLTNFFMGLSIGANVLVARYFGAKNDKDLSETVHTAMMLSIYSGIILTVIGVLCAKQILIWMQTPEAVLGLATVYLRIYFLGMTATMIYNFGSAILRAVGDTKRPLYYLFAAGIVNVILNLIFVIGFKLSVMGVAIATVISQCISAFLILKCMVHESGSIRLDLRNLGINKEKFIKIVQIGLPASLQGVIFSLSNVVIQSSVNSFGEITVIRRQLI
jgi:Na+-driven multidrug efflux pump